MRTCQQEIEVPAGDFGEMKMKKEMEKRREKETEILCYGSLHASEDISDNLWFVNVMVAKSSLEEQQRKK